mmetsp:Transcript_5040/g.5167  ORF Transcript_5040/g.5167 Transcript_5040/m.5167 type:complete len:140 (-) Transcript_5040:79-498(-)
MSSEGPSEKKLKMAERIVVDSPLAPAAIGPYSQAIKANGMVYVSGCLGMSKELKALVTGGVGAEARQVLTNLKNIVEESGSDMSKVVKCTILLTTMDSFVAVNAVYSEFFPTDPPARATFAVVGLPAGALVEIDCIAIA